MESLEEQKLLTLKLKIYLPIALDCVIASMGYFCYKQPSVILKSPVVSFCYEKEILFKSEKIYSLRFTKIIL